MSKIVVIGSSNIDLAMRMSRLPTVGESVTDAEFMQTFGGKGANQAVAAARAGGTVSFVNCVGEDPYAKEMVDNFAADGIDTSHITVERGVWSGTALIMVGEAGSNYLSVAPGANYRLTPERIRAIADTIADSEWVVCQYEILPETVEEILAVAKETGTKVMFNFAPARVFDRAKLASVHTLVVNEPEAATLAERAVTNRAEAEAAGRSLVELGCNVVIVTLGADGSLLCTREGVTRDDVTRVAHVPAFPVDAVDTTAAGDTYCGCLAVALAEGLPLDRAVVFASAAAALSVQKMGAQPSAPRRGDIDAFLAERTR